MKKIDVYAGSLTKNVKGEANEVNISLLNNFTNCSFDVVGNGNRISIGDCSDFKNVDIYIRGNNNTVSIGERVSFERGGQLWIENDNCVLEIGEETSFVNAHLAVTENNSTLKIGKDCMFAYDIDVRTGDSHSIIDMKTSKRTNYAKDVVIGNRVWIASHCSILKGVTIADNCVVATRSLVTKSFLESGTLIGGNPAKILKTKINWDRKRI